MIYFSINTQKSANNLKCDKNTVKHKGFIQSFMCNDNENIHKTAVTAKITRPSYYPSYNPLPMCQYIGERTD